MENPVTENLCLSWCSSTSLNSHHSHSVMRCGVSASNVASKSAWTLWPPDNLIVSETLFPLSCCVSVYSTSRQDRKSTRLNSSHVKISYAVFWLEKKT